MKYKLALTNYKWSQSGNWRKYNSIEDRDNDIKSNLIAPFVNIFATNLNDLVTMVQYYKDENNIDPFRILNCNYAILEIYNDDDSLNRTYYYKAKITSGEENEFIIAMQIDAINSFYYDSNITFDECMINRAHLDRFEPTEDPTKVRFNLGPDSDMFLSEGIANKSKRLLPNTRKKLQFYPSDTDPEVIQWFEDNIDYWIYVYFDNISSAATLAPYVFRKIFSDTTISVSEWNSNYSPQSLTSHIAQSNILCIPIFNLKNSAAEMVVRYSSAEGAEIKLTNNNNTLLNTIISLTGSGGEALSPNIFKVRASQVSPFMYNNTPKISASLNGSTQLVLDATFGSIDNEPDNVLFLSSVQDSIKITINNNVISGTTTARSGTYIINSTYSKWQGNVAYLYLTKNNDNDFGSISGFVSGSGQSPQTLSGTLQVLNGVISGNIISSGGVQISGEIQGGFIYGNAFEYSPKSPFIGFIRGNDQLTPPPFCFFITEENLQSINNTYAAESFEVESVDDFEFNKDDIINSQTNTKYNPKLLGGEFKSFRLVDNSGNFFDYDKKLMNSKTNTFLLTEALSLDTTRNYTRLNPKEDSLYTLETINNLTGLIASYDSSIPYRREALAEFLATNSQYFEMANAQLGANEDMYQTNRIQSILSRDASYEKSGISALTGAIGGGAVGSIIGGSGASSIATALLGSGTSMLGTALNRNIDYDLSSSFINLDSQRHQISQDLSRLNISATKDNLSNSPASIKQMSTSIIQANAIDQMGVYVEEHSCLETELEQSNSYMNKYGFTYEKLGNIRDFDNIRKRHNFIQAEVKSISGDINEAAKNLIRQEFANGVHFWNQDEIDYNLENYENWLEN